jgi:hypothetical protein
VSIGDAITRRAVMDKKPEAPEAPKAVETVPFFARKVGEQPLVVHTNVKAGLLERRVKSF